MEIDNAHSAQLGAQGVEVARWRDSRVAPSRLGMFPRNDISIQYCDNVVQSCPRKYVQYDLGGYYVVRSVVS